MSRRLTILMLGMALAGPAFADEPRIRKVPLQSEAPGVKERKGGLFAIFTKKSKRACIESERIAGAIVTGERAIDLVLTGGDRWRMGFKKDCPALTYYQGFYYRQTQAGRLCAGRDAVLTRSGAQCPIDTLAKVKSDKKRE
ncbi:hypothetical protein ACFOMD_12330 [Sphingoaurantiacus capsulatus]|uniref:Uncharacterized protein n=1 Tax=Sphingoaurantiacus capsulatus TaxID=1771310 RepID=A0ABV7XDL2_9SPHN